MGCDWVEHFLWLGGTGHEQFDRCSGYPPRYSLPSVGRRGAAVGILCLFGCIQARRLAGMQTPLEKLHRNIRRLEADYGGLLALF